ncbi:MAG: hypothetical protein PHV37_03540 [Candidatus Gastranaerophilales bacterium]|nr:hypothetical protein [Candidatus Gastranaerophilales bacterium]
MQIIKAIDNGLAAIVVNFSFHKITCEMVDAIDDMCKSSPDEFRIVLDLQNVEFVPNKFFSLLKKEGIRRNIVLLNMSAEINSLLYLMNYDKYVKEYMDEADFIASKRLLVNRKFRFCAA